MAEARRIAGVLLSIAVVTGRRRPTCPTSREQATRGNPLCRLLMALGRTDIAADKAASHVVRSSSSALAAVRLPEF